MPAPEERRVQNEIRFRDANEQISKTAERLDMNGVIPLLCECHRSECHEVIRLTLQEYEEIRADPARFICFPGHEEGSPESTVIERGNEHVVVRKSGVAGRLAYHADPPD